MKHIFKVGDKVKWIYKHNIKKGVVIGITGKVKVVRYVSGSVAIVQFEGNKNPSKIPVDQLKFQ